MPTRPLDPLADARSDALVTAAWFGDLPALAGALQDGADPNRTDVRRQWPPLMFALFQSQGIAHDPEGCLRALLAAGADPLASLPEGDTVLERACGYALHHFVCLWEAVAPVDRPSPASVLRRARRCTLDIARWLLNIAGDLELPLADGDTLFVRACREEVWDVAHALLDEGARAPAAIRTSAGHEIPLDRWLRDALAEAPPGPHRVEGERLLARLGAR
jgi:hypothetical protein